MKFSNVVRSEAELRALMADPVAPLREVRNSLAPVAAGAVAVDRGFADARRDNEGCCFNPSAGGYP
jgi:hypothetical protein